MIAARIGRTVVSFPSLFFAGLALGIWVAPEYAARQAGIEAVRSAGTAMLQADGGGLFAGMAVLCGAAAWTGRRSWIVSGRHDADGDRDRTRAGLDQRRPNRQ